MTLEEKIKDFHGPNPILMFFEYFLWPWFFFALTQKLVHSEKNTKIKIMTHQKYNFLTTGVDCTV